jgi:hypothetical protein
MTQIKPTGTMTRCGALKPAAASAAIPPVHIRTGRAAGKVSVAFWDHWMPSGNAVMQKQADAWEAKNQMEVQADFIAAIGPKDTPTIAAEAQPKTGHEVQAFPSWDVHNNLNPMLDFKVWEDVGSPKSAVYSYPIRPFHNAKPHIAGMPAPPEIAVHIYSRGTMPTMLAKLKSGRSIDQVIARANDELEDFAR